MRYVDLHLLVTAMKNETASARWRFMVRHYFECRQRAITAERASADHRAAIYFRSMIFAMRRAAKLRRELP